MVTRAAPPADQKIGAPTATKRNTNVQHAGKELAKAPAALNSNITQFDDSPSKGDRPTAPVRANKIIFLPPGKP